MEKFNELIQSTKPVLVDFYAEWCGPCKIMKPRILDVAERMGDNVKVVQIDVDKEKELATRFRISSVPTLIIFKNGKQQWRQSGIISALALMKLLQEYQKNNEKNPIKPHRIVRTSIHIVCTISKRRKKRRIIRYPNEQTNVLGQSLRLHHWRYRMEIFGRQAMCYRLLCHLVWSMPHGCPYLEGLGQRIW